MSKDKLQPAVEAGASTMKSTPSSMMRRVSDLPPAKKGFLLLLVFAAVFATLFGIQNARANDGGPKPPVLVAEAETEAVPETVAEPAEAAPEATTEGAESDEGFLPTWGWCFGEDSCAKLSKKLNDDMEAKFANLKEREDALLEREAEFEDMLAQREEDLVAKYVEREAVLDQRVAAIDEGEQQVIMYGKRLKGVGSELMHCVNQAMEELDAANATAE